MKKSVYCSKHRRRHSVHAQLHCVGQIAPGKCKDKKGNERGDKCPIR